MKYAITRKRGDLGFVVSDQERREMPITVRRITPALADGIMYVVDTYSEGADRRFRIRQVDPIHVDALELCDVSHSWFVSLAGAEAHIEEYVADNIRRRRNRRNFRRSA